jgi:hypothetical protein
MQDNTIVIRVATSVEDGLMFDIWTEDVIDEDVCDSEDGGACTSGMDNPDKPWSREDWENALEMAKQQALDLLFPKKN